MPGLPLEVVDRVWAQTLKVGELATIHEVQSIDPESVHHVGAMCDDECLSSGRQLLNRGHELAKARVREMVLGFLHQHKPCLSCCGLQSKGCLDHDLLSLARHGERHFADLGDDCRFPTCRG